jgi:uncharacterized membrane protein (UPF0127 family)
MGRRLRSAASMLAHGRRATLTEPVAAKAVRLILALLAVGTVLSWGSPGGWGAVADVPAAAEEARVGRLVIETTQDTRSFRVELARSPEELAQGLQHRRSLPADAGMLFDFGPERIVTMWMKNTYIPLDMLFIDAEGTVADIAERTTPLSLETIASQVPVRAVLEVNAGTVAALGIRKGDRVHHPIFPEH